MWQKKGERAGGAMSTSQIVLLAVFNGNTLPSRKLYKSEFKDLHIWVAGYKMNWIFKTYDSKVLWDSFSSLLGL